MTVLFKFDISKTIEKFCTQLDSFKVRELNTNLKEVNLDLAKINNTSKLLDSDTLISVISRSFDLDDHLHLLMDRLIDKLKISYVELAYAVKNNDKRTYSYIQRIIKNQKHIDIIDFLISLAIIVRCDFKEKLHLLFDIVDSDKDGFINEKELKIMISKINLIFCNESAAIKTDSTLMNQSLSRQTTNDTLKLILNYPGNMHNLFLSERYVTFSDLYKSIQRIKDYKFKIFPRFVNIKAFLEREAGEPVITMDKGSLHEYLSIKNELVGKVKTSLSIYGGKKNEFDTTVNDRKRFGTLIETKGAKEELVYNRLTNLEVTPGLINVLKNEKRQVLHSEVKSKALKRSERRGKKTG